MELWDITQKGLPDFSAYQVIGFASFTNSLGPPALMQDFIKHIPEQKRAYAFVFNTYANFSGRTLKIMKKLITRKGFTLIAGHSLRAPENYPPYIIKGIIRANAPNPQELQDFESFITILDGLFKNLATKSQLRETKIRIGWFNFFLPPLSARRAPKKMGMKFVDVGLCNECRICEERCPYQAITLNPKPVFATEKCYGCWSCYNHCPTRAIYTGKLKGSGHYPMPSPVYQAKLGTKR